MQSCPSVNTNKQHLRCLEGITILQCSWFILWILASNDGPEGHHQDCIVTRQGLVWFTAMPFGLCNTPFEQLMELVLAGLKWKICLIYLDDVIFYGGNFYDALDRLKKSWQRVREANQFETETIKMLPYARPSALSRTLRVTGRRWRGSHEDSCSTRMAHTSHRQGYAGLPGVSALLEALHSQFCLSGYASDGFDQKGIQTHLGRWLWASYPEAQKVSTTTTHLGVPYKRWTFYSPYGCQRHGDGGCAWAGARRWPAS